MPIAGDGTTDVMSPERTSRREEPGDEPSWGRLVVSLVYFLSLLALVLWILG